jgi:hypothetical protein
VAELNWSLWRLLRQTILPIRPVRDTTSGMNGSFFEDRKELMIGFLVGFSAFFVYGKGNYDNSTYELMSIEMLLSG